MLKRFTERLIFHKDKLDPETYMQGRYFVWSFIVMFVLCFSVLPYYLIAPEQFEKNPDALYANTSFIFVTAAIMFAYSKWGGRVLWVNIMCILGLGGGVGAYEKTGGIWSSDQVWGIVMIAWAFLLAGRTTGIIWALIGMAQVVFFYIVAEQNWKDFGADALNMTPSFPLFNYMATAIFLLTVIWLYDASKKIFVRQLRDSKAEVDHQKKELETQKEEILSSIAYAKKIQEAIIPHEEIIARGIPLSFILYKPRDIVSGDFYWFHEIDRDNYIFVCGDCTGHGVPGAFMTVIGCNILMQIIKENRIHSPSEILVQLDLRINETLRQDHSRYSEVQDGMDLSLVKVNKVKKEFIYTSAKRPAIFIRDKKLEEFKGSKLSIGGMRTGTKSFEEITVQYKEDDMLYLFTDGYIDQFGGPQNKKFMITRFRELLQQVHHLPLSDQKQRLDQAMREWIGTNEQTDDILVAGIRF